MQYRRDKKGNELSVLGYGCMRFTKNGSSVDLDKAEKEVMAAIKAGVNYFDTAYVYAGNEAAVRRDLRPQPLQGADLSGDKAATLSDQVCRRCGKDVSGGIAQIKNRLYRLLSDAYAHRYTDLGKIKKDRHAGLDRGKISVRSDQKYRIFLSWKYRDVQTARGCLRLGFLPDPVQLYG